MPHSSFISNNPLEQTRFALLSGEFYPGQKLKPDHLRTRFGISAGSMREVLLRLAGEGLLEMEDQKGFNVPAASTTRMAELMHLRGLIECEGARASIMRGDLEWEAQLNAAHYKLSHIEQHFKNAVNPLELLPIWTRADNQFHEVLVSAADSKTLSELRTNLFQRARQQVVACEPGFSFRPNDVLEHAAILNAALARDSDACEQAIILHLDCFKQTTSDSDSTSVSSKK